MQNTLLGLLAAGNENCCLQEMKPAVTTTATPTQPVDMFGDDEALKEQEAAARAAKAQREKEEKERRERERKEKERKEKEEKKRKRRKKVPAGLKRPSTSFPMKFSRMTI